MKQWLVIVIVIILIIVIVPASAYLGLKNAKNTVDEKTAAIELQFEKREELIGKILVIVMIHAAYEYDVISQLSTLHARLGAAIDMAEKADTNKKITEAMKRVDGILEAYPDLRDDINFRQYSTELYETEKKIDIIRVSYNTSVRVLNRQLDMFPANKIAAYLELSKAEYYDPSPGDDEDKA